MIETTLHRCREGPGSPLPSRRVGTWLAGFFFLSFVYFLPWIGDWDQDARLDLSLAVANHATLSIDPYKWNTGDVATSGGHYYSITAPGQSLLGVPVAVAYESILRSSGSSAAGNLGNQTSTGLTSFILLQYLDCMFAVAVPATLLLMLFFWFLQFFTTSVANRLVLTLGLGLGTIVFPYAKAFYSHVPAALLLFAAFALVHVLSETSLSASGSPWFRERPRTSALLVGLLLGSSEVFEYTAAIIAIFVLAYALVRLPRRLLPYMVLGGLPGLAIVIGYSLAVYHNPFVTGYSMHSTLWGHALGNGVSGFSWPPRLTAVTGMSFSPYRGLFFLSPFLMLAFPGGFLAPRRERAASRLCLSVSAVYFLVIAMCPFWDAGSAIGPRYLIPILPFLALPVIFILDRCRRAISRITLYGLVALSILAVGLATLGSVGGYPSTQYANPLFSYSLPFILHGKVILSFSAVLFAPFFGANSALTLLPLAALLAIWTLVSFRRKGGDCVVSIARPSVAVD